MVNQIDKLIQHKGYPCLSVILPTYSQAPFRYFTWNVIKRNLDKAHTLLKGAQNLSEQYGVLLENELNKLSGQLDSKKFNKGLGIFISPSISSLIYFPFAVQENVIIGDTFETRDLFYYREYTTPYYVMLLSRNRVNLFKSDKDGLSEVTDSNFPMLYSDDYEYNKPSRGTSFGGSLQAFEKDRSSMSKERMATFFKEADRTLNQYLKNLNLLIVCGTREETSRYINITDHRHLIAGTQTIQGNDPLSSDSVGKFNELVFKFKHEKQKEVLRKLDEDFGNHQVAEGLENVWRAANEGNGLLLAVEKNFKRKAYLQKNDHSHLYTMPPKGDYKIVPDAVDDLIETVHQKNGKVMFVENEELKKFHHIAMLLRYKSNQPQTMR